MATAVATIVRVPCKVPFPSIEHVHYTHVATHTRLQAMQAKQTKKNIAQKAKQGKTGKENARTCSGIWDA